MSMSETLGLLGRVIGGVRTLGFDALAEPFGGALPLAPASLAKPVALNRLLKDHGTEAAKGAQVTSV